MADIEEALFRKVLGYFPTGVTFITAASSNGKPIGFVVGSFFSVSPDPALVGFCAGKSSSSWPGIRSAGAFCVNILAEDQQHLSHRFSMKTDDRFANLTWTTTESGSARLTDVLPWIDCDIEAVQDAGDHEICIGRVHDLHLERDNGPLVFCRGDYGRFTT